jgi:putative tryptophan/tyrosine transport system substrate-binding protein
MNGLSADTVGQYCTPMVGLRPRRFTIIGYLDPGAPEAMTNRVAAFRKGLSESGFTEGRDVAIEFRWARSETERMPELAADLVRRNVAIIVAPGSPNAALELLP